MTPPLVTLLSAELQIRYVVTRTLSLIVQKQSQILAGEVRMSVCKCNDPLYVKLEKIAVMVQVHPPVYSSMHTKHGSCKRRLHWTWDKP